MPTNVQVQEDIDKEVAQYKGLIRNLLTRRNTHAGISTLPNELIAQIFIICTALGKGDDPSSMKRRCQIMLVCTMWRDLAMNTPRLWSSVSLKQPRWVGLSLQRSKEAPLVVHFARTFGKSELLLINHLSRSETHRFKELHISWPIDETSSLFSSLFNGEESCAPLLETLDINIDIDLFLSSSIGPTIGPTTMEHFWMGLTRLRSMTLRNALPSLTPDLPSLTHLNINIPHEWNFLSVSWLLNLLRNTPMLEVMNLGIISSDANIEIETNPSPVSLPHLRFMNVILHSIKDLTLFSYLNLPPNSLFIHVDFFDTSHAHANMGIQPEIVGSCLRRLISQAAHFPEDNDTHILHPPVLEVTVGVGDSYTLFVHDKETTSKKFHLLITHVPPQFRLQMIYLTTALSLERIQVLSVWCHEDENHVLAWTNILPLFIHLKAIETSNIAILQSLAGPDSSLPSSNSTLTSAGLSNPELEEVNVSHDNASSPDDWLTFVRTCKIRRERGVPFTKVTLFWCSISEETVGLLQEYAEVDWKRK